MDFTLAIAFLSTVAFAVTLLRHILLKRDLLKLKADMKRHTLEHGIDDQLWVMFVERTRKMFSFWR